MAPVLSLGRSRWSLSGAIRVAPVVPAPAGHMMITKRAHQKVNPGPSAIATVFPGEEKSIPCLFTVQESRELPKVIASVSVKSIILPTGWLEPFNAWVHRYRLLFSTIGFISSVLVGPAPLVSPQLGVILALISCVPMIFIQMLTFLGLRYDMLRLVIRSYEFWYLSIVNTVCCVLLAMYYQDVRAILGIATIGGFQCVLLIDANFRAIKHMTTLSLVGAMAALSLALGITTGTLQEVHDFPVLCHRNVTLMAGDVIAHGFVTSAVLLLRNAYYKRRYTRFAERHDSLRANISDITVVRCVGYQCRLTWRAVSIAFPRLSQTCAPKRSTLGRRASAVLRLRSVGTLYIIRAQDVFFPVWSVEKASLPQKLRAGLRVSGFIGFLSTGFAFIQAITPHNSRVTSLNQQQSQLTVATLSIMFTSIFVLVFVLTLYERTIFIRICHSFDFLFLSTQVVMGHVCLALMCEWDFRGLSIISSCLWLHWVITLDALPPLRREQLGFPVRKWAKVVTMAGLILVCFVNVDLVVWNSQQFVNHSMLRFSVRGRVIEWRVMSFLLNRSVSIFVWLIRLLFRQMVYKVDDLVMLSGAVEYEDTMLHRRRVRMATKERLQRMAPKIRALSALDAIRKQRTTLTTLAHIPEISRREVSPPTSPRGHRDA
ncbi:hypothetical protein Poli38472_006935 [Pythium oligandrum]|uniref:Transmembrane protein n=1 Tax=Pythium oligandrum TaxID=41045 RepID=A0A8K1C9J7_PYTOL|nr:hypothetical protein Poli38472_006935 [Pythium oligandrum]|eukprot:TMW58790.1 hypothetical protein Poli38472_006935 [Pythium oligandrum]